MLSEGVHGSALILGATVYLGYSIFPTVKAFVVALFRDLSMKLQSKAEDPTSTLPAESDAQGQPSEAEQHSVQHRQVTRREIAAAIALAAIFVGVALSARGTQTVPSSVTCPVDLVAKLGLETVVQEASQPSPSTVSEGHVPESDAANLQEAARGSDAMNRLKFRGAGGWKFKRQTTLPSEAETAEAPSVLLMRARAATDQTVGQHFLEACTTWTPPSTGAELTELLAQLECNRDALKSGAIAREAASALLARARQLAGALGVHSNITTAIWESTQLEWARISHGVFQLNCKAVADSLQSSRRAKTSASGSQAAPRSPTAMLAALWSLKRLKEPFQETLAALASATKVIELRTVHAEHEASLEQQEFHNAIGADRACAVQALLHARSLALVLPRNAPPVRKLMQCQSDMLEDFEALVSREAAQAKDSATMFNLGLYYSDIGLSAEQGLSQVPLFGSGAQPSKSWASESLWAADAGDTHAPSEIVQAEALMVAGEEASEQLVRSDLGAARALRLYQHAKMLALKHHDSAAEWRYRAAAELAAANRRHQLAAHALGRLGYFLSLRGRTEDALAVSAKALEHGKDDALAQYLQASLKRSMGELQTTQQILEAERQLSVVAGKLPSKILEDQRATSHAELGWWRQVATGGLHVCLKAWDAAQMLICLLSGLAFELPGVALEAIA